MRRPITVAKYLDVTEAQLARVRLGGEGIEAFVIEGAGFNPLLSGAAGGVQLQVRERDLDRAQAILAEIPGDADDEVEPDPPPGGERVVRCPRCELEYCFFERGAFVRLDFGMRWHCRKCDHVWDSADQGPLRMTPREPGDPRPVFRLRRGRGGTGVFLGLIVGFLCAMALSAAVGRPEGDMRMMLPCGMLFLMLGVPLVGWRLGAAVRSDVCSVPECRAPLPRDLEECPGCKGTIAGTITSAPEHYAALADVRRELAASRKAELPAKRTKKPIPLGAR